MNLRHQNFVNSKRLLKVILIACFYLNNTPNAKALVPYVYEPNQKELKSTGLIIAKDAPAMAQAMSQAVQAGRQAFMAGRLPQRSEAVASSPTWGMVSQKNLKNQ